MTDGAPDVKEFLRSAVAKVGPILLTAAGFLGFVAVVGGVVVWFRFYTAQIPSVQAIDAMPRSEMLVNGAVPLILFGVVGVVAVAACYAIDNQGKATEGMARSLMVIFGSIVALAVLIAPVELDGRGFFIDVPRIDVPFALEGKAWFLLFVIVSVLVGWGLLNRIETQSSARGQSELYHTDLPGFLALLGVVLLLALFGWRVTGELWVAVVVLVAATLALLNFRLARGTENEFTTFGVIVFFSIPLFGAIATFLVLASDPLVQPAAVVRSHDEGRQVIEGIYVTETDSHVYLGSVATDGCGSSSLRRGSGSMFRIPRDEVVSMRVGRAQSIKDAMQNAAALTRLLVRNAGVFPRPNTSPKSAQVGVGEEAGQTKPGEQNEGPKPAWPLRHTRDRAIREEPDVSGVDPSEQTIGGHVSLSGERFGRREGRVRIAGQQAQVVSWEDDEIEVIVPSKARRISRVVVLCPDDDHVLRVPRPPGG
jgi:hypothetical protein